MGDNIESRQPMGMLCIGQQGVGKTYTTLEELEMYRLKFKRPCLIVDINNEYDGVKAIHYDARIKSRAKRVGKINGLMGLAGIHKPYIYRIVCKRPDNIAMTRSEMVELILTITEYYRNGALVLEEMNTYIRRNVPEDFYSFIVKLRHNGIDLWAHYQAMADPHPDLFAQFKLMRLHKAIDSVRRIRGKIPNYELTRIAELAIDNHFQKGTEDLDGIYYNLYIDFSKTKIRGISESDFREACDRYLYQNNAEVRDIMKEMKDGRFKYPGIEAAHEKLINDKMIYITA